MKPYQLIILIFFCLFLTGCSHTGQNINPFGVGGLFNRGQNQQTPNIPTAPAQARPTQPIKRPEEEETQTTEQRSSAANGRNVPPTDNSTCLKSKTGCTNSGGDTCDFPAWLTIAWSFNGLHEGGDGTLRPSKKPKSEWMPRPDYRNKKVGSFVYTSDGQSVDVANFHSHTKWPAWLAGKYKTFQDDAAWCGSFVEWCLTHSINPKTGKEYPGMGSKAISSQAWLNYGQKIDKNDLFLGTIMILSKKMSHVTFLVGIKETKSKDGKTVLSRRYLGLGGNQGDSVKISEYNPNSVGGFVAPLNYKPCKEHKNLTDNWYVREYLNKGKHNSQNESVR